MLNELPETVDAMRRYGGGFVKSLANAITNADTAHYFALALIEMRARADNDNRELLYRAFSTLWDVYEMTEEHRVSRLQENFSGLFDQYAEMARYAKD